MKLYHPHAFQGNLTTVNYFEGWYYKQVSSDMNHVWSFIPGISLTKGRKLAFIQLINGISGETHWFEYPIETFEYDNTEMKLRIGNSWFTENKILIDIAQNGQQIKGEIEFSDRILYPVKWHSPGIMGWYSFVPFMECKHGIVSVSHHLKGKISLNGVETDFTNGKGYIEKDWGTSFPESWIWIHGNHFKEPSASFTFSVAKIPWLGHFFIGHICFLYVNGVFYNFATHNGSKINKLVFSDKLLEIRLENKTNRLLVKVRPNIAGKLKAPEKGSMTRIIKESIDSTIELILSDKQDNIIFEGSGNRSGFELTEGILDYFNK